MSGQDDLNRSKASAEAETGPVGSPVQECKHWVGIDAHYDDPWRTPITSLPVDVKVEGATVASGPLNMCLSDFGKQDGDPHADVRDELSRYRVDGVTPGAALVGLKPQGGEDPAAIEAEIDTSLSAFEAAVKAQVVDYTAEWTALGWGSVPRAYIRGLGKGGKAWWDGEVDFWSSVGEAADAGWDAVELGAQKGLDYWESLPWYKRHPIGIAQDLGEQVGQAVAEWLVSLWDRRDDVMALARAFVEGSVENIERALEALVDLPGDLGTAIKDAVENSAHWVQHMIEVARETRVFQRTFGSFMKVVMMLTPNFWAELRGTVEGFIIPEVIISAVLALIGALATAASSGAAGAGVAAAFGARMTKLAKTIRSGITAAGKALDLGKAASRFKFAAGKVLGTIFTKTDEIFEMIGRLSRALRAKIDETVEGATGAYNRILRRTSKLDDAIAKGVRRSADDVNAQFPKGYEPPYKPGTEVTEFAVGEHTKFVRVYGENSPKGSWVMREEDIAGLTPAQIKDKFALPAEPTSVIEVVPPAGTKMRTGIVNPIFGGSGGAQQFEFLERVNDGWGVGKSL